MQPPERRSPLLQPSARAVVVGVGGLGHIGVQCLGALTPAEIIAVDRTAVQDALGWGMTVAARC
jgi:NAD+-dependent secondary alcohol dehydrogenase Adh1